MNSNDEKAAEQNDSNLKFQPRRRLLGPDVRVKAPGGVVPTRGESEEELRTRRDYGVGKY